MGYPENNGTGCTASSFGYDSRKFWVGRGRWGVLTTALNDEASALTVAARIDEFFDSIESSKLINEDTKCSLFEKINLARVELNQYNINIKMAEIVEMRNLQHEYNLWCVHNENNLEIFIISNNEEILSESWDSFEDAENAVNALVTTGLKMP